MIDGRLGRRALLAGAAAGLAAPRALAFGDEGAFHPRLLLTGTSRLEGPRARATARWAEDLRRQTSAPSRVTPGTVRADAPQLLAEPFAVWAGEGAIAPLTIREVEGLRKFLLIGGILLVDDAAPEGGAFGRDARRELARVLPESAVIKLPEKHVVYHSFYLLARPVGRVEGPDHLDAISLAGTAQVLFSSHDLLGALAREREGTPTYRVEPGGERQRELATRLAVNIAMYVLCSNYKDDQVHAPMLMKRRAPK
ncbi:MAG: DUF4159 domain-containing protein [Polyangiaceae bacterium]|nr:DUF4159 domain-containing protein [Polyangiaceae bacterium]